MYLVRKNEKAVDVRSLFSENEYPWLCIYRKSRKYFRNRQISSSNPGTLLAEMKVSKNFGTLLVKKTLYTFENSLPWWIFGEIEIRSLGKKWFYCFMSNFDRLHITGPGRVKFSVSYAKQIPMLWKRPHQSVRWLCERFTISVKLQS